MATWGGGEGGDVLQPVMRLQDSVSLCLQDYDLHKCFGLFSPLMWDEVASGLELSVSLHLISKAW